MLHPTPLNTQSPDSAEYKHVRGLSRGLAILKALNAMEKGRADCAELSQRTGLHRTTVRRLLETLMEEGFVWRSESDGSYRLTLQVRSLSEGFTDDAWISTLATPLMGELLQSVVWPSDLATPDGESMMIRETTHRFSPLSFHRAMVGRRLPMLLTSAGRAYFAYCQETEREDILELIRQGDDTQAQLARDDKFVRNLIRQVRHSGFGTNNGDWDTQRKVGAIAVPILRDNIAVASLNVVYLSRALSTAEALRRYGDKLQEVAQKISTGLVQTSTPSTQTNPP